ncbi:MAG: hypothetical protein NT099_05615 [Candidatus Saganbacteria bacterium]|nr:hypothetical protein [Candidatus Saganbacteria bacterium]
MLKTIRIIILFLVLSGTAFAGPGINTIIAEATFPLNPTDGQAKYGFVFNKALGNWTKLIESGTITSWYDKNANTLQESDELTVKNYKVYQIAKVFSAGVFISNDVKYGTKNENGIMPAQENDLKSALESLDRSGYKKGEYITGVGDRAISGYNDYRDQSEPESNIRITEGVCVAVVGPATVRANVSTLFITEGADKYTLAQNFKFPNWYLEKETLNSKKDGWFLESNKAAVELTRQAVNNIQIWVDQKVGRGNGFKGYYALDLVPFLLKDSEVPKSLVNSGSNQNPSGGSSNVSASLNSKDGKETYSIYLINFGYINESDSTDDQVFTRAHEKFVQETKSLKRPETLTYDGADEAVRMVWRDGTNREAIIFRRVLSYR